MKRLRVWWRRTYCHVRPGTFLYGLGFGWFHGLDRKRYWQKVADKRPGVWQSL